MHLKSLRFIYLYIGRQGEIRTCKMRGGNQILASSIAPTLS